ncbi:hypothetical protein BGZ80_000969 [Entomortierella chlamydospora]|uniref:Uncharacterized protein n=1 Tax=Entomortierella chlamydospora TaxID=101097 RepID=A0A9P6SY34_9FUNG|nr:hypothetical protein BGZ80_000969 [Entomortierella chlamydospora]
MVALGPNVGQYDPVQDEMDARAKFVFWQETYYTAADQAVISFKQKYMPDCEDFLRDRKIEDHSSVSGVGNDAQVEELKAQVADMNNKMEDMMTMMKQILQERRISDGSTN